MKKVKYILASLVLASSLSLSSCSDDFLDTTPTSQIGDQTAYSTGENLMTIINGMHRNMYTRQNSSQGNNGYTGQMIMSDVMGDDVIFPANGNGWFVSILRWLSTNNESNADAAYPWNFWYAMTRNANNVITYGEDALGDQNFKKNAIGQAYAFRAFGNFQLVQLYGNRYVAGTNNNQLGIVLRLDPSPALLEEQKARGTVEEAYAQIWADLNKAEELLTGVTRQHKSHFSIEVILGLKARVALVQQDYVKAAQYAALARQGKQLMVSEDYLKGFNDFANREWMWGVTIQDDQSDFFGNFHAYMSRNYNSTQIRQAPKVINRALHAAFPSTDVRTQVVDVQVLIQI